VNVDLGIWSKLTKIVVALFVIAILVLIGAWYLPLIQTNERYREHIMVLEKQLQEETAKSQQLQTQIDALTHDPETLERLAREKLGYAKPGETVIRFEQPATNNSSR
jgi:cell division protein FtsB